MNRSISNNGYLLPVAPGTAVASVTMLSIASLVGFLANARVCLLIRKHSDLRKVPHYLFSSLAVNGIFNSLLNLPSRLALTVIRLLDIPVSVDPACSVLVPSGFACNILNAVTLSLMAIDRQDCVLRPFKRRMDRNNIPKVIVLSWIGALVLTSPIIFKSARQRFHGCDVIPRMKKARDPILVYVTILSNFFNIVSVLIIVVTALRIIKRLRSSPLPKSNSHNRRQENQLIWLTYKICGVFLVCKLPIFVYFPLAVFLGNSVPILPNVLAIVLLISNFSYVVNPFLFQNMLRPLQAIPRAASNE